MGSGWIRDAQRIGAASLLTLGLAACGSDDAGPGPQAPAAAAATTAAASSTACDGKAFTAPESSPYILPYPEGSRYLMSQGNCSPPPGGHQTTFAYDFELAFGDPIHAARGGTVTFVQDGLPDTARPQDAGGNMVWIIHSDGTVAAYLHMMNGGPAVTVGQEVARGEFIGLTGNSGRSADAHLHFQVFADNTSFENEDAIPITFSNAEGILGTDGELLEGRSYTAGAVDPGLMVRP